MSASIPEKLLIVAGSGTYPMVLAQGARAAGVGQILVAAVRGMATRRLHGVADEAAVFGIGEIERMLQWAVRSGARHVVMAGQVTPLALFRTRFDPLGRQLLGGLRVKNAHTIFGQAVELLMKYGLTVLPASSFISDHLLAPGRLTQRAPDEREWGDIQFGLDIALKVCALDIGQTVVVKEGMVLAVEAFEGTNRAIRRGGRLGGRGAVVVKVAKEGHDMRFDLPVIGAATLPHLRRARVSALALQAGRVILLDRDTVIGAADRLGMAVVALDPGVPDVRSGIGGSLP